MRELRKIASTSPLQEGWEDDYEFKNALEAHLVRFIFIDFVLLVKCISFVFENHPLALADIDKDKIKEQDSISLEELFTFLQPLTNYAKYHVLERLSCNDRLRKKMMTALGDNQKETFVGLAKDCINISDICLQCGYASKIVIAPVSNSLTSINSDSETDEVQERYIKEAGERFGKEVIEMFTTCDDIIELVKEYSMFKLDVLDEDFLPFYCVLIKFWLTISPIIDTFFLEKELTVFNNLMQQSPSKEIYSDLERLVYLLYGFSPTRLFTPESYNFQELAILKEQF